MKRIPGALGALILWGLSTTAPAPAQEGDAFVLPRGTVRLQVGLQYTQSDSRFAADGTEPLASDLLAPLSSETFAPLGPLEAELNRFFAATDARAGGAPLRADPQTLLLGTPDLDISADVRVVPVGVEAGILPRVEVGVVVPFYRAETVLQRFALPGATVGLNPDPAANAAILGALGEEFRALGAARLLPTAGSALGADLLRRVQALGGGELALPAEAADTALFRALLVEEFGLAPLASELSPWRMGDAEVGAKVRLLSTFGELPFPADSAGLNYRVALRAAARLPTGSGPDTLRVLSLLPDVGVGGWSLGADGDLFWGERFWATASARFSAGRAREVERRPVSPSRPLASAEPAVRVRWTPAPQQQLRIAPRFRLTDAIALGAAYELVRLGEATYERVGEADPAFLNRAGGTFQRLGATIRYTTLPAYTAGADLLPVEVMLAYEAPLAGPEGAPVGGSVRASISLFQRFWGGR